MKKQVLLAAIFIVTSMTMLAYAQSQSGQTQQDRDQTNKNKSDQGRSGQSNLDSSDRRFVMEASEAGMSEVRQGQMAVQRASSEKVKQFAQQMVDDHTKANQELMQLASTKGITLPQDGMMSSDNQTTGQSSTIKSTTQTSDQQTTGQTSTTKSTTQTQSGDRSNTSMGSQSQGRDQAMVDRLSKLSGAEFDRAYMQQQMKDHEKAVELFQKQADKGKDQELKDWASKTLPTLREHHRMVREIASTVGSGDKSSDSSGKSGKSPSSSTRP